MKTIILKTTAILLILAGGFSCGKDNKSCSCEEGNEGNKPALEGTQWTLAGIMDVETCDLKELEPKDCDCYTLTFDTDSTAQGKFTGNEICLELLPRLFMSVTSHGKGDTPVLYDGVMKLTSCTVTEKELRICYNEGRNYLLFRKYY